MHNYLHLVALRNIANSIRKTVEALGLQVDNYSQSEESNPPILEAIATRSYSKRHYINYSNFEVYRFL